ncbi:hypothetical protein GOP47_0010287 [Adiantum capillus-veneris]|uniref:GATA transcription factor n=1 Tax=Adiantum capillus-veneris TaxID=13818 RepID=A0A9D4UUS3_ADICA|nr:hypothetical protein GOP47_0010287 [Adiantum capillus-veneris]
MDIPLLGCEGEHAEFLAIDDLLDFSNDDIGGPIDSSCLTITSSESTTPSNDISTKLAAPKDKNSALQPSSAFDSDELCIRCDDLAELEWLSNFVEESFSSCDHATVSFCIDSNGKSATDESKMHGLTNKDSFQRSAHSREKAMSFTCGQDMSVPARARTKRGRTAVCFWNTQILSAEASESILESSSTASTITSDSDMINNTFYDHDDDDDYDENEATEEEEDDDDDDEEIDIDDDDDDRFHHQHKQPVSDMSMKVKKFSKVMASFAKDKSCKKSKVQEGGQQQQGAVRKCLHCATQKTPQWRAGPMGPKTLCNACGVRYKSGRLCAEYRPAASPTFVESLHSNSHRKVLEMKRQRGEFNVNSSSLQDKSQCRLISRVK